MPEIPLVTNEDIRRMRWSEPGEIIDDGEARARQAAMVAAKAELVAAGTVATAVDAAIDAYNEAKR